MAAKFLIVRFSSFGDIVQAMSVPAALQSAFPDAVVDWLVRDDFADLLRPHPLVQTVWAFDRKGGLVGLWNLSAKIHNQRYTHIYDAHNNVRSYLFSLFLRLRGGRFRLLRRPKNRIRRYLLFRWQMRVLPYPFKGILSFLEPLARWSPKLEALPAAPQFFIQPEALAKAADLTAALPRYTALVPSAAWPLKRWPINKWKELIRNRPGDVFVILGGPQDLFCEEIRATDPTRVFNWAGQLSLQESAAIISQANCVVANDTGLLHVADQLGRPTVALIGPSAFGYPSHSRSATAEIELWCKPCSKDGRNKCKNSVEQRCLKELSVEVVAQKLDEVLRR